MKGSCELFPSIQVNGKKKESELFKQLKEFTGSYNTAWNIWGLTQSPTYMNSLSGIEYDENNEPTFESLNKVLNIKDLMQGKLTLKGDKITLGAVDTKGNPITYNTQSEIIDKVNNFNKENTDKVAQITQNEKGYNIIVDYKNEENSEIPERLLFSSELNNKLLGIMRANGFDAKVNENLQHNGIFTPLSGEETADGLKTVIQIAKGQRGEDAFPEEFSHWLIEAMGNNPMVTRLLNTVSSEEVQRRILGDEYEHYAKVYKGDTIRMQLETAGKLLQKHITKEQNNIPIARRLWDKIKSMFVGISEDSINKAINEANEIAGNIASMVHDDNISNIIDPNNIVNDRVLYSLENETTSLKDIAEEALETASRRLKIIQSRSKNKQYDENTMKSIKQLQQFIDRKKYAKGCLSFLNDSIDEIKELQNEIKKLNKSGGEPTLEKIRRISYALRIIKEFSEGYLPVINNMKSLEGLRELGEIEISEQDALEISQQAQKLDSIISVISKQYKTLRYNVVYDFLKMYWGEDKIQNIGKNKGRQVTLAMIMKNAEKDINGIDRWIQSLSDASDPMLSLVDKAVKVSHRKRDEVLNEVMAEIRAAHKMLLDAGESSEFMYERDENGKLTGRIISDINFVQYDKEREEYLNSLKEQGLEWYVIQSKIESWERKHTEEVVVDEDSERTERLPKESLYHQDVLSKLNTAQRKYYDDMLNAKAAIENLIPSNRAHKYLAVQIRGDLVQSIASNLSNPKQAIKLVMDNMKDDFTRREDDTEFGEQSNIMLDFNGRPVDKLPIYYTTTLENMDRLSTDFSSSLAAYAGMAINYNEMNKIIDVLELTRDFIHDREVQQYSGDKKLEEVFTVLHNQFRKGYTKSGTSTNISARIDDYYESVIYGKSKKDQGTLPISFKDGSKVDVAKTLDNIRNYTGNVSLGLNLFTALSNITVGKFQLFMEAIGSQYYNYKNIVNSKKKYYQLLPQCMAEINSPIKTSKLALLMQKFDAAENSFGRNTHAGLYNSTLQRIFGRSNLYFLMTAGEHYLRGRNMLSMLDAYRVFDEEGNEMSLDEAFEVSEIKDDNGKTVSATLVLKEGVQDKDGNPITQDMIDDYALKIGKVSQSLNGALSDIDKGAINRQALGRMAMQFRQWMPAHYNRRFAGEYYDAIMEEWREGFYRTLLRFNIDLLKDLKKGQFNLAAHWSELNNAERANIRRALTEIATYYALSTLIMMMGPAKDKKGRWADRLLLYNLKRMKLEVGATMPLSTDMLQNVWTLLQSPAASMKSFNNIGNLVEFQNMFVEIESGRYKGWNKYVRDLVLLTPIYNPIRKAIDLSTEDYMFQIFNK